MPSVSSYRIELTQAKREELEARTRRYRLSQDALHPWRDRGWISPRDPAFAATAERR